MLALHYRISICARHLTWHPHHITTSRRYGPPSHALALQRLCKLETKVRREGRREGEQARAFVFLTCSSPHQHITPTSSFLGPSPSFPCDCGCSTALPAQWPEWAGCLCNYAKVYDGVGGKMPRHCPLPICAAASVCAAANELCSVGGVVLCGASFLWAWCVHARCAVPITIASERMTGGFALAVGGCVRAANCRVQCLHSRRRDPLSKTDPSGEERIGRLRPTHTAVEGMGKKRVLVCILLYFLCRIQVCGE